MGDGSGSNRKRERMKTTKGKRTSSLRREKGGQRGPGCKKGAKKRKSYVVKQNDGRSKKGEERGLAHPVKTLIYREKKRFAEYENTLSSLYPSGGMASGRSHKKLFDTLSRGRSRKWA